MADKKKRTILMSEAPEEVTPPSDLSLGDLLKEGLGALSEKANLDTSGLGVKGKLFEIPREDKPDVKGKWKVGIIKGAGTKYDPQSGASRRGRKARAGFQIEVKF